MAVFQALESVTGKDHISTSHVRGHSGDPWNDLVDLLAKLERSKSFYLPRQDVDIGHWAASLPFLWWILAEDPSLPGFTESSLTPLRLSFHRLIHLMRFVLGRIIVGQIFISAWVLAMLLRFILERMVAVAKFSFCVSKWSDLDSMYWESKNPDVRPSAV